MLSVFANNYKELLEKMKKDLEFGDGTIKSIIVASIEEVKNHLSSSSFFVSTNPPAAKR